MNRKDLLRALKVLANKNKEVWASNREISRATGLGVGAREKIGLIIDELEALGAVRVDRLTRSKRIITLIK